MTPRQSSIALILSVRDFLFENMQLYEIDKTNDKNRFNQSEIKVDPILLIETINLAGRSFLPDTEDGENKLRTQHVEAMKDPTLNT